MNRRTTRHARDNTAARNITAAHAAEWILAKSENCQSDALRYMLQTRARAGEAQNPKNFFRPLRGRKGLEGVFAYPAKLRTGWLRSWHAGQILRGMDPARIVTVYTIPAETLRERARAALDPEWRECLDALDALEWGQTATI